MRTRICTMRLKIGFLASAAVLGSLWAAAQESNYLDLTDPLPRERVRPPQLMGGECSGGSRSNADPEATVTLVSLDKSSYVMGEEVTFEVKVQNTGKENIEIPWAAHSADIEPSDATETYSYLNGMFYLNFKDPISERSFGIFRNSYGSASVPVSLRTLKPGEWVSVRVRRKIEIYDDWWWTRLKDPPLNLKASADIFLYRATYVPSHGNDPATETSMCMAFPTKTVGQFDVTLWPREQP